MASASISFPQLDGPWAYLVGFFATGLMLGAVAPIAVTGTVITLNLWWSATQSPLWLVWAVLLLGSASISAWQRIPRAVRQGRRLRAAASGATSVNPSAQRAHGRHRG
ncbi:MAG: hypothetical protein ACRDOB_07850 [Streptosporangiaceae bacterium]